MNRGFYARLALNNVKKNSDTYVPYIFTCIMTVMMFYIMRSLSMNPGISRMIEAQTLATVLGMGSFIVGVFSFIFLFYTNSFLVKRRKREFGIFNILGMEKKHLARVIALETLLVAALSLVSGLLAGIALDKVMFLLVVKMVGAEIPLGFFVSGRVIRDTMVFFAILFLLILLRAIFLLRVSGPVELLKGGNMGEREPKTKWVMAMLGMLGLAGGYYIALTVDNPIASIYAFFAAVLLVILATYLLFTAGSIALLKLLRKNKAYYYQTRHFISVSGMIYRMKRNAVGLANICILSTMVLVTVSATSSFMLGFEDIMRNRYPNDFSVYSSEVEEGRNRGLTDTLRELQKEAGLPIEREISYHYIGISAVRMGDSFITNPDEVNVLSAMEQINVLLFSTLDDYNAIMGESKELKEGEVLLYSTGDAFGSGKLAIFGREYQVAEVLDQMYDAGASVSHIADTHYIVLPDMEELKHLNAAAAAQKDLGLGRSVMQYYYGFDTAADEAVQASFYHQMQEELSGLGYDAYSECREENRRGMLGIYGGLFFLGIFLGTLFMMATVLIIYYKQISEGHEDRERFAIMQKVGLSREEARSAIRSQVLTVFFLPLLAAGFHLAAAFPMLSRILAMFNMSNTALYITCCMVSFTVFAVVYVMIYILTAKTYLRMLEK